MPGGGFVTNEIKLPENWNELVAPLGYEPIENFYLNDAKFQNIKFLIRFNILELNSNI